MKRRQLIASAGLAAWACWSGMSPAHAQGTCYVRIANPAPQAGDQFGTCVAALDQNRFAVLADRDDAGGTDSGTLYIYESNGALARAITNLRPFGFSFSNGMVSLSRAGTNLVALGFPETSVQNGCVTIYDVNTGQLRTAIRSPNGKPGFGAALAAFGTDEILIGATQGGRSNFGAVYRYAVDGTPRNATIDTPLQVPGLRFGDSLAVLGEDRIFIGDPRAMDGAGRGYIFRANGVPLATLENIYPNFIGAFPQTATPVGDGRFIVTASRTLQSGPTGNLLVYSTNGNFLAHASTYPLGRSAAPLGSQDILAGASQAQGGLGDVGLVLRINSDGIPVQTYTNPAPTMNARFGASIASLDSNTFVVGAPGDDYLATDAGTVYLMSRSGADCNGNGLCDSAEIRASPASDCNANQIPDACEIASNPSLDCNSDGILDTCPSCKDMDVVFILDTSSTMIRQSQNLCSNMPAVVADLSSRSINIRYRFLSITTNRNLVTTGMISSDCFDGAISTLLGTDVPGENVGMIDALGITAGRDSQADEEDWGPATAIVASRYPWTGARGRLIVPISDTDPCPLPRSLANVETNYWASISNAIAVAVSNNVVVSPIYSWGVLAYPATLAAATGGQLYRDSSMTNHWRLAIEAVTAACSRASDCDGDGVPDECDPDVCTPDCDGDGVLDSMEADCDRDGVPDDCAIAMGRVKDENCDGVPDSCQGDATFRIALGVQTALNGFQNAEGAADCKDRVYIPVTHTNGCPPVTLSCNLPNGVFEAGRYSRRYPIGQHLVEITATDARGRTASASSTVSITDKTGPRLLNPP